MSKRTHARPVVNTSTLEARACGRRSGATTARPSIGAGISELGAHGSMPRTSSSGSAAWRPRRSSRRPILRARPRDLREKGGMPSAINTPRGTRGSPRAGRAGRSDPSGVAGMSENLRVLVVAGIMLAAGLAFAAWPLLGILLAGESV